MILGLLTTKAKGGKKKKKKRKKEGGGGKGKMEPSAKTVVLIGLRVKLAG